MSFFRKKDRFKGRSLRFESLEHREMLSVAPLNSIDYSGDEVQIAPEAVYPLPTDLEGAAVKITDTTSTTMTISWDASEMTNVRTSDSFSIERLSINSKGEEVWTKVGTVPYSYTTGLRVYHFELTGLTALTEYTHRVSYGSTTLGTGYTDRVTKTTEANEITAEPASSTSITLSWNFAGKNSTRYEIWMSPDGTEGSYTNTGKYETATGSAKAVTHTIKDLDPATEYYFKIKYIDTNSKDQETQPISCKTMHTLNIDETTSSSVELYWDKTITTITSSYQLQITTGTLSSSSVWNNATMEAVSGGDFDYATYMKYKISGLKDNTTYHFRLRYNTSVDNETVTMYTDPLSFATPTSLSVGTVTDTTAVLNWTFDTKSGTAYYIQVRSNESDSWSNYSGANTTNKTYTLKDLEVGTTYEVRIAYTSPSNSATAYSASETVTTAVPTTLNGVTENSATVSWNIPNKSTEPGKSIVSVQRCDGSLDPKVDSNWKTVKTDIADGTTSYTNNYLGSDKKYYFRVEYTDTNGDTQHTLHIAAHTSGVITSAEASIDNVTLEWDFTPDNTNYTVQMAVGAPVGFGNVTSSNVTRTLTGCTITGLTPSQLYYFRIVYTPADGSGTLTTKEFEVYTESSSLIATAKTESSITLHWAPTGFTGGVQSGSYVIYYCEVSDRDSSGVWKEYANTTATSYTVKDLIADTVYQFKVGYVGSTESTAQSSQLTARTEAYTLSVTGIEETKAQLTWTFSTYEHSETYSDKNGDGKNVFYIDYYIGPNEKPTDEERLLDDDTLWYRVGTTAGPTNRTYNLSGLVANTTYYYRVSYALKTGDPVEDDGNDWKFPQTRKYSKVVEFTTSSDIRTDYVSSNSVKLSWDAKTLTGGSTYTMQMRVAGTTEWPSANNKTTSSTSYVYEGLTAGTDYEFRVLYNVDQHTATVKTTTAKYIPSVVYKEIGVENATATVQMKYTGAESNFELWYREKTPQDNGTWVKATVTETIDSTAGTVSMTITTQLPDQKLFPEQQYEFEIRYEANGQDLVSETIDVSLSDELNPENVTSSSVKISWSASSFADKSSTSEYTVQWREVDTTDWKGTKTTASTSDTVSDLEPNKEYEFRVMYYTVGGAAAYSTIKTITTAQPKATASTPQVGSVKVEWAFNSASGGFTIQYKDENGDWLTATTVSTNTSRSITFDTLDDDGTGSSKKLDPETEYTFRIAYKSSASGDTVYSEEVEVMTLGGLQLVDNSITTSSVAIKWDYVTDATFSVFYRVLGSGSWTYKVTDIAKTETGYTISGLNPGTEYEIQLNYTDDGTPRTEELVIKTTVAVPAAPEGITAGDITSNCATVKWIDKSAYEEDYILEVINSVTGVTFFKGSIDERIGSSASSTDYATHELTGLDTNTKYTVKLYAVNSEGSSAVATGTFTTKDVDRPKAVTIVSTTVTPKSVTFGWKITSIEDQPDPTKFRIEYEYTDPVTKVKNWYEVTNVEFPPQDEDTGYWYGQIIGTIEFGVEGSKITVTIENKTKYNFRIIALGGTVNGVTYGDSTATAKTATTADIKVPTVSTSSITLTTATVTVKDSDTTLDKSVKEYKLLYVVGKYTDWTKVPEDDIFPPVTVDSDTLKLVLDGLLAGTTYSYVVQWDWAGEIISSKPANFTTKALPKASTIKTGYTLIGNELGCQISWKPPAGTKAIPIDGMDISYTIEVSLTGKEPFTPLVINPTLSTSPKGLVYCSVSFNDLAKILNDAYGVHVADLKSLSIRISATFKENDTQVGISYSSNGKITLPKFA